MKQFLLKIIGKMALTTFLGGDKMAKVKEFLQGNKTYVVIIIGLITGIAKSVFDIEIPDELWIGIFSALGITLKAGWNRTEEATKDAAASTKELIAAIQELKKMK